MFDSIQFKANNNKNSTAREVAPFQRQERREKRAFERDAGGGGTTTTRLNAVPASLREKFRGEQEEEDEAKRLVGFGPVQRRQR